MNADPESKLNHPLEPLEETAGPANTHPAVVTFFRYAGPALMALVFCAAFGLLYHEIKTLRVADIARSFRSLPATALLSALAFTVANYIVLIGYDLVAVRLVKKRLTLRQIATASLLSYAFSNSLGTALGGTPIRARLYSSWGFNPQEIIRLVFFIGLAFWIGLFCLSGMLFVVFPFEIPSRFNLPLSNSFPIGVVSLIIAVAYFAFCAIRSTPIHIFGINFQPPALQSSLAQALIASIDFLLAAATLYCLLPPDTSIGFFTFVSIFLLSILIALVSHVPGGLGVMELFLITMLPNPSHQLVASLVMFRVIYYLLPLGVAVLYVAYVSAKQHHKKILGGMAVGAKWAGAIGPRVITGAVFIAGVILLISGALPSAEGRLSIVRPFVPLPLIEISHFLGSFVGAMLLILARSLQRRIDAGWTVTVLLLVAGIVASLAKGFDYEEAIVLLLLIFVLILCRKQFYRRGKLLEPSFDLKWIVAILLVFGLTVWLVVFAHKHVEYRHELWWRFAYNEDAPRSIRALVGASVPLALVSLVYLLRPHARPPAAPTNQELAEVAVIVANSETTISNLALLGDKLFSFSQDRKAFVMFGCEGRSWVAMGDPVGPEESADDAAWRFREMCDANGMFTVFYQVDSTSLGRYIEMGLSMIKLGEEARVPLKNFSLDGSSRKDLRRTCKKSADNDLHFKIVHQSEVPSMLPQFKAISEAWLADKQTGEKGFSLGFFEEKYLAYYDMAIVTLGERPIAFANVLRSANKRELSIDLMRYLPDAPYGVMEFLFVQLMLLGRDEGYEYFNLGMAPLSGVDSHRLGPIWNRVSSLIFRHGEHFYNFQGLRNYKEKFDPEWSAKYLASPGGFALPQILANVSTLISGGLVKLLRR